MARHKAVGSSLIVCHVPWALLTQPLLRNCLHSQKSKGLKCTWSCSLSWWSDCENFHLWQQSSRWEAGSLISSLFPSHGKLMSWRSSTNGPPRGTSDSTDSLQYGPGTTSLFSSFSSLSSVVLGGSDLSVFLGQTLPAPVTPKSAALFCLRQGPSVIRVCISVP